MDHALQSVHVVVDPGRGGGFLLGQLPLRGLQRQSDREQLLDNVVGEFELVQSMMMRHELQVLFVGIGTLLFGASTACQIGGNEAADRHAVDVKAGRRRQCGHRVSVKMDEIYFVASGFARRAGQQLIQRRQVRDGGQAGHAGTDEITSITAAASAARIGWL